MSYVINKIKAGSTTFNIASTAYATCATSASTAAKVAYISGTSATSGVTLTTGLTIHVKFTYTNTAANPTLSVNGTTAKAIKCYGTTAAGTTTDTSWFAGETVTLTYDGSYWQLNRNIINLSSLLTYINTLEQTARDLGIFNNSGSGGTPGGGGSSPDGGGVDNLGNGWVEVTDLATLQSLPDGSIIVITVEVNGVIYALTWNANTNNLQGIEFSFYPADGILSPDFEAVPEEARFILGIGEFGYTFQSGDGQYLYTNTNSANRLKLTAALSEYCYWTFNDDPNEGGLNIYNYSYATRKIAFYLASLIWAAYPRDNTNVYSNITIYVWRDSLDPDPSNI